MKTPIIIITLGLTAALLAQGPLTPPPGANSAVGPTNAFDGSGQPQATMKSLHQVEPRTPLAAGSPGVTVNANGGFTISAAGSYYLTGNLTIATGNGIVITTPHVSLDLRGFVITHTGTTVSSSDSGVRVSGDHGFISISNGLIRGPSVFNTSSGTISAGGLEYGILANVSDHISVSGVSIEGARGSAFLLNHDGSIRDCHAAHTQYAFSAEQVIGCTASDCRSGISTGSGGVVSNCHITAAEAGISADNSQVSHCQVQVNNGYGHATIGIDAGGSGSLPSRISHCTVVVSSSSFSDSAVTGIMAPGGGVDQCTVSLSGSGNLIGISAENGLVDSCTARLGSSPGAGSKQGVITRIATGCSIDTGYTNTITNRYNMP